MPRCGHKAGRLRSSRWVEFNVPSRTRHGHWTIQPRSEQRHSPAHRICEAGVVSSQSPHRSMPVMGASSSPPSHTLKRIVRRPAKSPPVPSCPLGFGHRKIQSSCTAWGRPALQAFRPSELGSVQTGGGNQIDRCQEGPHGGSAVRAFLSSVVAGVVRERGMGHVAAQ